MNCKRCGRSTYRGEQFTPRLPARRCVGCHYVVGRCYCSPLPTTVDGKVVDTEAMRKDFVRFAESVRFDASFADVGEVVGIWVAGRFIAASTPGAPGSVTVRWDAAGNMTIEEGT